MSKSIANRRVFPFAIVLIFFLGGMSYNGWSQCQLHCPDDVTATCEESGPDFTGYALLTPCSGFGMFYDEMEYTGDCGYIIHRHWYYPGLGNCEQLITVVDTASPEFVNVPPDYAMDCNEVLPEPTACLATDACDDQLEYDFFAGGTEGTDAECTVTAAIGPGPDWAFWLPGMVPGVTNWQFSDNASFVEYADGTAHLTGTIYNPANPLQSFEADIWLENGMNWTDWSALGRSYKDDLNLAGDLYTTWMYYELANGFAVLNGSGSLTGSQVWLHHFPFDYYYGFQCGEAANNKNSNYGLSGWIAYEGVVNGVEVEGEGDINLDKDCVDTGGCASTVAYYIWRAEDDCGHVSFATQHITITDTTAPVVVLLDSPIEAPCDALPEPAIEVTDDCSNVFIEVSDEVSIEGCPGQIIRTYTITDACGNATTASQVINLIPDDGPFFVNFPENLVLECSPDIDIPAADVQFEGACSNP
ncbi:MAG: hypothetical protein JNM00_06335, partial [Flavobacteriales bacterium]|nr:hypothetical protein [Flavobacteriales bacterium]